VGELSSIATAAPAQLHEDTTPKGSAHKTKKYPYIDALRGYAVLFVITCHTGGMFGNMPYPVKKLTNVGWHGVQLFFLISCVTLMMSWRSDERKGIVSAPSFWVRRFFRISPMYYLAALFYFYAEPPASGFDLGQMFASLGFINAWHPTLIPTVPNRWMVVPGGWSVGVEFTFYFFFPLMALLIRDIRKATIFFLATIVFACVINSVAYASLVGKYGDVATANFIYFWLPNQLPVFALGTILFFLIDRFRSGAGRLASFCQKHTLFIILSAAAIFVALAELKPLTAVFSITPIQVFPHLLAAAIIFACCAFTLSLSEQTVFVNRAICELGKVSFSAYLLHFFVLHKLSAILPFIDIRSTNYRAIATFFVLWCLVVPITFLISKITYEVVELPMIRLGNVVADRVRRKLAYTTEASPSS
jgi:peptidoglycan/LPS O-acetylase OafA/YrhL